MMRQRTFNGRRFLGLIKNDLFMNRHLFLIASAAAMGLLILFFIVMIISEGLLNLLSWQSREIYNPLNGTGLAATAGFWVFQSVFVCGAIYFRKHAPVKTVLALVGYGAFLALAMVFTQNICLGKYVSGVDFTLDSTGMYISSGQVDREMVAFFRSETVFHITSALELISNSIFLCVVMPLCWVMAYVRLREMEI